MGMGGAREGRAEREGAAPVPLPLPLAKM